MYHKLLTLLLLFTISLVSSQAELLRGNFWHNPTFEAGENLDSPEGTPSNWNRGGSNPAICQVSPSPVSPTHGIAVVDTDNGFGEWYSDLSLAGRAQEGDQLDIRWYEAYDIVGSEMRVTILFFGSGGGTLGVKHFVARGQSEGFTGDFATTPYVERNEVLDVPEGAATMRVSLVSGGSVETTGTMVIDDVSVARHPAPILLPGNLWTNNPTFEEGTDLDQPTGTLTHWNRGGSQASIDQVTNANSISPTHALAVVDTDNQYGEWYSDLNLTGIVRAGDILNLQWFEMFNVSAGGEMRLTVLFLTDSGGTVDAKHFVARGQSAGWTGDPATSPFVKRNEAVTVPEGAAKFRVSLVSGGPGETTGTMIVDDFSMNKAAPPLPDVLEGNVWHNPGFEEGENLDDPANAVVANWSRGGNDPTICILSSEKSVSPTHSLALQDNNDAGYGEWYSNLQLGSATAPGKLLNLQWFEMYNISDGEMRLTLVFFNENNQVMGENHFVVRGPSSGWQGTPAASTFTRRNEQVAVPLGSRRLQVALVSGGPLATKGTMLIDNLSIAPEPSAPVVLFGNFWPNPGFEEGTDLDKPNVGKPQGWDRGGADVSIDQVITSAYTSSSHALAVVDNNPSSFGEWYQFFELAGKANPGDEVEAQWWELYNVNNGEMRLSLVFFNAANSNVGQQHYVVRDQSTGWNEDVSRSFFTKRNEKFTIPAGATKMLVTLTSGGPSETTGILVIDDLSFAKPPPPPDILAGNFWPNPTFEEGTQLDRPTLAVPAGGWNRGGTHIPGDQVTTLRATSPTHALAVVDTKEDAYSEWYVEKDLTGLVAPGQTLEVQWYQVYDTTSDMRLSIYFRGADGAFVGQSHFMVNGQPEGWTGDLATTPFVKRTEQITVPDGAVRMMVNMASGGSLAATGTFIIDDLSMRVPGAQFNITRLAKEGANWQLTWESIPGKTYAVEASPTLSPPQFQVVPGLETVTAADGDSTTVSDPRANPGPMQFYIVREVQ